MFLQVISLMHRILWPHVQYLNKKGKYLLDNATQNIKAISLEVSDKKISKFFEHLFCPCDLDIPFEYSRGLYKDHSC